MSSNAKWCVAGCLAVAMLVVTCAVAQTLPKFEAASIKPEPSSVAEWNTTLVYPGGRFLARGCTVRELILVAYGVQDWQVSGGPEWAGLNGERFHIEATPPENSPLRNINPENPKLPPPEEERLMIRALLRDRFHLVISETNSDTSGYALLLKGRTSKLADAKKETTFPFVGYGRDNNPDAPDFIVGESATMDKLAQRLSERFQTPVVNETNLEGEFDFKLNYVADSSDPNAKGLLLPAALQELGLEMKRQKVPLRRFVVEHIEKLSEN